MTLTIRVHGTPAPQGSKRHVGNGVMVESSAKVKPWREAVKWAALEVGGDWPIRGPVGIFVGFTFARPRSHYGTGRNAATVKRSAPDWVAGRPDIDKLLRSTLDGLSEAGVWLDDAQVVSLGSFKMYGSRPGADIQIDAIEPLPPVVPVGRGVEDVATGGELG